MYESIDNILGNPYVLLSISVLLAIVIVFWIRFFIRLRKRYE